MKTTIRTTLAFSVNELDEYLARETANEFLVSADFRNSYQETILLPPVSKGLVKRMLLAEMRKKNPSLDGELAIVYFKTGEKAADGRRSIEYFVIAVVAAEIDELVRRFLVQGKRIKALYPTMLAVLKLLPLREEPYICHFEEGSKKNLFLIKGGKVLFTRSAASIGEGLVDYDIQNINMTINYCRQALRVEPVEVLCIGEQVATTTTSKTIVPTTFLTSPPNIAVDKDTLNSFLIPVALLGRGESQSIATDGYRQFYLLSSLLVHGTRAFVTSIALLAVVLGFNIAHRADLEGEMARLRATNGELSVALAENRLVRQELVANRPLVRFMNKMVTAPSPGSFLGKMRRLPVEGLNITRFQSSSSGGGQQILINGSITANGYLAVQKRYEALQRDLTALGLVNINGNLVLKDKTFTIQGFVAGGEA
jgi:hypothetical protein